MALQDFVTRFHPGFLIGAMDPQQVSVFGQYGPQTRTYVPMLFLIDRAGVVQGQFLGSDTLFQGDAIGNLRASLNFLLSKGPATTTAKKVVPGKK